MRELNEKLEKNKLTKQSRGITLIALVITIIVLLILAGVTIATLTGDNGLLQKARESKNTNEKGQIEEQIKLAYNDWKLRKETGETVDLQNTVQTTLDKMYDNATVNKQGKAIIINVKGYEFTLVDDGTMEEGKLAYLDIADGNIDLYSNGYKQYTGNLQNLNKNGATQYTGKYIITGTTTENVVRVCGEGTYDITIKDLNIDVQSKSETCAFNANKADKATGCFVNLILESKNHLKGNGAPGLGFSKATPNVDGASNGSTLTINGNGKLKAEASSGSWAAGIGSGYTGWEVAPGNVSNIIINSGNITAIGGGGTTHGAGIGTPLNNSVNNIIINGGTIEARGVYYGKGIGDCNRTTDNIIIKGGNIFARGSANMGCVPTDGTNNLYETPIKLDGVAEGKKITKLTTSDNIEYGIKDMYTLENGMLYLYLSTGTRTITIEVDGKTYSGTVQTTETPVEVTLSETN